MKNALYFTSLVFILSINSCVKDFELATTNFENLEPIATLHADLFPQIIGQKNGYLVFEDIDAYLSAMQQASTSSTAEKIAWNNAINFQSVAKKKIHFQDAYEAATTQVEVESLIDDIDASRHFTFNDGFIDAELFGNINWFITKDQQFYIGDKLYKKTADYLYVIMDGDPDLLHGLEERPLRDEARGIYVFEQPTFGQEARGPYCSDEHQAKFDRKRLRYRWKIDYIVEPVNMNGTVFLRNTYNYDAEMEAHRKSGFIWKKTWIDVRFSFETDRFDNFLVDCTPNNPAGSACSPSVNFPTNVNIIETRQDVWNADITRPLFNFLTTCACPISETNYIYGGNYRSYVDRTDDNYSINQAGLHVVITCGNY